MNGATKYVRYEVEEGFYNFIVFNSIYRFSILCLAIIFHIVNPLIGRSFHPKIFVARFPSHNRCRR